MKTQEIPSDKKSRNKILKENIQKVVFIKRISNGYDADESQPVFLERFLKKYFSTYIKLTHKDVVKRSNIAEISDEKGNLLWKINNKNKQKK